MAQLTKLQTRTMIQQLIDDTAAKLWSATNLDLLTEAVLDELWGDLLEHSPFLRSTEASLAPIAPGYIDVSTQLTRFFRLQQVTRNDIVYTTSDQKDSTIANNVELSADNYTYTFFGDQLHLFPIAETPNVFIRYSSRPAAFSGLADGASVDFPDGHYFAYVYATAARAMEKGDRENSDRFERRAENALLKLKAVLRKRHTGPVLPWMPNDAIYWGGV